MPWSKRTRGHQSRSQEDAKMTASTYGQTDLLQPDLVLAKNTSGSQSAFTSMVAFEEIFSLAYPTSLIKSGIHAFGLIGLSSPNLPTGRLKCLRQLCSFLEKHFRFSASNCLHGGFQRNFQCLPTHTPNAVVKSCIWVAFPQFAHMEGERRGEQIGVRHKASSSDDDE